MNFMKRLDILRENLKGLSCDGIIVDDPINLFYFIGIDLSAGRLLIHSKGAQLLVDGRYLEICKQRSPVPVILAAQSGDTALQTLFEGECSFINRLGFNTDTTSYKAYQELQKTLSSLSRQVTLVPLDSIVKQQRMIKDDDEIDCLRDAAHLGSDGYDFVTTLLKEGITESELAIELEIFWKRRGGTGVGFDPIIAFGPNSSMPHYRAGNTQLRRGDTVLIDIGVLYHHYHSDMTRVIFFGDPPAEMQKIYRIVKQAQHAALSLCRPDTTIGELDDAARKLISEAGYGELFMHNLGHGVGLEIHEMPSIRNKEPNASLRLQPGMVITIEPGIYLPGIGGVRLEDTVVITDEGHENLTKRPV